MRTIVQKFGGTSLSGEAGREAAVRRAATAVEEGLRPVLVVSAMGRRGEPYATDTLLELVRDLDPHAVPRERDLLASCGELISAAVISAALRRAGLSSVALTGGQAGIVTDDHFSDARLLRVEPERLRRCLERGSAPVVAGFQGMTEDGEITTLGRGGSDTTAAALAAALGAEALEIYTDVDGVFTADPRIVADAQTLLTITYEEVGQMAVEGARVLHPRAVEIAMRANLPVRVRSTFSDGPGTLITHTWNVEAGWPARDGRVVTGLAHIPDLSLFVVRQAADGAGRGRPRSDLRIFRALADAGISVDMINVSPERKAFAVQEADADRGRAVLERLGFEVSIHRGCAKVTVIGAGMRGLPGVMAEIVEALDRADVEILLSVDSHITISSLVERGQLELAIQALHDAFALTGANEKMQGTDAARDSGDNPSAR